MHRIILYITLIFLFLTSCQSLDSVKRGLTGEKQKSTDEFLIKKKDPLILPPDFENLPTPDERVVAQEEILDFEKTLETSIEEESSTSTSSSVESSILKKIQSQ
tara:strand:+ start:1385 stop:1696 length:312 start_codon:yes stop_codon:yes gene_type:complete